MAKKRAKRKLSKKARSAMRAAALKSWAKPKMRARRMAVLKKLSRNPKWLAANRAAAKKRSRDPKWRAANAAQWKKVRRNNPKWLADLRAASKKSVRSPRYREPEWQAIHEAASEAKTEKMLQDPKWRAAHTAGIRAMFQDPDRRAARNAAWLESIRNPFSEKQKQLIIRLYKEGWSINGISRRLGGGEWLGSDKITRVLRKAGVYMTPSERAKWRLKHGISGRPQ